MSVKKFLIFFVLFLFVETKGFGQNRQGVYSFYSRTTLENSVSYINFSNDSFIFFSLKRNAANGKFDFDKVGSGQFVSSKGSLLLNFDNKDKKLLPSFIKDSIECLFTTSAESGNINISFRLKDGIANLKNGTLHIETSTKDYDYILKNDSISVSLPGETIIRSLKFFLAGFDARVLPFDSHFNNLKYSYTLNDQGNVVAIMDNTKMEFQIKSAGKEGYRFTDGSSLLKTNQKSMEFLTSVSKTNPQLQKILN